MFLFRNFCRKYKSTPINSSLFSFFFQIFLGINWVFEEPQDAVGDACKDFHPHRKRFLVNLVQLVEICENEFIFRQIVVFPLRSQLWLIKYKATRLFVVICEIGVRHVDDFFRVEGVKTVLGRGNLVCDHVVDEVGTHRTAKTHVLYLNRGRF